MSGEPVVLPNQDRDTNNIHEMANLRPSKRSKTTIPTCHGTDHRLFQLESQCASWLAFRGSNDGHHSHGLPAVLFDTTNKIHNRSSKLQAMLQSAGVRTALVQSPQVGVSVYTQSLRLPPQREQQLDLQVKDSNRQQHQQALARLYLSVMLGLHPWQTDLEFWYHRADRPNQLALHHFLVRLQTVDSGRTTNWNHAGLADWITNFYAKCDATQQQEQQQQQQQQCTNNVHSLVSLLVQANPSLRHDQLDHECQRIQACYSSLANVLLQVWAVDHHAMTIEQVIFKPSPDHVNYERFTFILQQNNEQQKGPPPMQRFLWLPSLHRIVQSQQQPSQFTTNNEYTSDQQSNPCSRNKLTKSWSACDAIVQDMVDAVWQHLLRHGRYFASKQLQQQLDPALHKFFTSGLIPFHHAAGIPLHAHFEPNQATLALYLHGPSGSGKSSLAKHLPHALQAAIQQHAHPLATVQWVKQGLNKPHSTLNLEFQLRPNNNDYSVMSIIQSRKQTRAMVQPGIVVVALEEMSQYYDDSTWHDPNQLQTCQLLAHRLAGRVGTMPSADRRQVSPKNADTRGMGDDSSIVTVVTSNYPLAQPCQDQLQRLPLFAHLRQAQMVALEGDDRRAFARAYLQLCLDDWIRGRSVYVVGTLQLDRLNQGDLRPLVRQLRQLAFYIHRTMELEMRGQAKPSTKLHLVIKQISHASDGSISVFISLPSQSSASSVVASLEMGMGCFGLLAPPSQLTHLLTYHQHPLMAAISKQLGCATCFAEHLTSCQQQQLRVMLECWLYGVLAPAVLVSHNALLLEELITALECSAETRIVCRRGIVAGEYKMMKSLYDPPDMPNLRDDFLRLLGYPHRQFAGSTVVIPEAWVAVQLVCPNSDSQLCIREMLEDSPSMTAFSTSKSALYKHGLLFMVHIPHDQAISPEIGSRASLIL